MAFIGCLVLVYMSCIFTANAQNSFASGIIRPDTPPMGWRSWNYFKCDIDQQTMMAQVDALVKQRMFPDGSSGSLLDLGYKHAGLDDCWQFCVNPHWFHDNNTGMAIINQTRFPDMKGMVSYGQGKNISMGFYMNNCRCHELDTELTHYPQDAHLVEMLGYDGIKIDSCGDQRNMTLWASLFTREGRDLLVESCGNGAGANPKKDDPVDPAFAELVSTTCPFSFFRVSEDVAPQFFSVIFNALRAVPYLGAKPMSRPGCWAYSDMLEVGVGLNHDESQSHFALWSIISSPLILGLDLTNDTMMDPIIDIISNKEVIAVSQSYFGHPGRLVLNSSEYFHTTCLHGATGSRGSPCDLPEYQVWAKTQGDDVEAVLIINIANATKTISVPLSSIGMQGSVHMRDLWKGTDNGTVSNNIVVTLPSHGNAMVRLTATK
eukprot:m.4521 g.4521  ORF g.4521 m.4521 type:complete len:433 (+) comp3005_c0_seq1:149-1447(+)